MNLLNLGLKFALPPKTDKLKDFVIDVEAGIGTLEYYKQISQNEGEEIRMAAKDQIIKNKSQLKTTEKTMETYKIIENLRKKEVYYTKADKGNTLVILDKAEYDNRMLKLINEGPNENVRGPLTSMKTEMKTFLENYKELFGYIWKVRMKVNCAKVGLLYGLPKIHQGGGDRMRPINSCVGTPCYNTAKWLPKEFSLMDPPRGFSIKNARELINELKDIVLEPDEVMVSFDIDSYFPSVPVPESIELLQAWLDTKTSMNPMRRTGMLELTKTCMKHSFFKFRGKFYRQISGTAMGNPLSPLICDLYVGDLEQRISDNTMFPRFWKRYVDDVFAIVKKDKVKQTLEWLNSQDEHIKFKHQEEENGRLAFLDLEIVRNGSTFEFKIYRKPTDTDRIIDTSSHSVSQRNAALNSMVFRLFNIPLNKENFNIELNRIRTIAKVNGYNDELVNKIIEKHQNKKQLRESTTLTPARNEKPLYISFRYCPKLTNKMKNVFKKHNIRMAFSSNNKLKNLLGSTKDKTEWQDKCGIYLAICPHKNCFAIYVGKCKRSVKLRFTEHLRYIKNKEINETAFTEHCVIKNHKVEKSDFKLLHEVRNIHHLDLIESLYIYLHRDKAVNKDKGNAYSHLFEAI